MKFLGFVFVLVAFQYAAAQTDQVNVFLGSSGDRGQMSPAASYPFSISVIPWSNRFVGEQHATTDTTISGWVESTTTCNLLQ